MKPEDLKLLIAEGEGLTVEFKERYTARIVHDIVAFANTKGGRVILGVSDEGKITGEALTNKMKAQIIDLARKCEPSIEIKKIFRCEDAVVIEVEEREEKPYSCADGYFVRLDGISQKMTQKEISLLYKNASAGAFEESIHKNVGWEDISRQKINTYLREANISVGNASAQDILTSLNLATKEGITNAGVLFFAKEPRRHILHCETILVAFKGTSGVNILDRKDVQDDLWTQYQEAMIFLKRHLSVRTEIKGMDRQDIYEIPLEALREAVANAIIHRDYTVRGTSVMVEVHEDKVIIKNPGGFPIGMDPAKLGSLSVRRNELIADIFARMHRVERVGSGFKRISENMDAAGLSFPVIESDHFFFITFLRIPMTQGGQKRWSEKVVRKGGQKITPKQFNVLELIKKDPSISRKDISEKLKINESAVQKHLDALREKGVIRRNGPDKGGYWEILSSHVQV